MNRVKMTRILTSPVIDLFYHISDIRINQSARMSTLLNEN